MWSMELLSVLCFFRSVQPCSHEADRPPIVNVRNGTIVGTHSNVYNQDYFLGIPFAQPPVDGLRFRNPQSLNTTYPNGLYQANEYAPACIGYGAGESDLPLSEDCLYLNVIRPSGYENVTLPVGLWIHGGGFTTGGSRMPGYNLSYIVENSVRIGKPIIGVSIAYRLSGWGFLASQQVSGQGQTNIALRDQRLAMHWTKENIYAFGGDPQKITIWGESAVEYSFIFICCPQN
jgi:carboxylesterase type B